MSNRFFYFFCKIKTMLACSALKSLNSADVLFIRHDADCGYSYDNKIYSPLIDSVVDLCSSNGFDSVTIATPYSKLFGAKAFNNPFIFNRYFFCIALFGLFLRIFFGAKFSYTWKDNRRKSFWHKILCIIKPRLIIGVHPEPDLCFAAKSLSIPVFDLQHGVVAIEHWPYAKATPNGQLTTMPTGFLCWDQQNANQVKTWAELNGASVYVAGHPWFERFRVVNEDDLLVQDALKQISKAKNDRLQILVSLQWGLHLHYYTNGDFNKVMCKSLETVILNTGDYIDWHLRLHPVQLRGDEGYECLSYLQNTFGNCSWVEWSEASKLPLPLCITKSDLHITDMSSVVIEASWFDVPSALLNPLIRNGERLEGLYSELIAAGKATVVEQSEASITSWINEKTNKRKLTTEQVSGSNRFESWLLTKL